MSNPHSARYTPYVIMDFGGYEGKVQSFIDYFSDCIDGIHMYNPLDYSNTAPDVYDLYHQACELAHSYDKTFIATVMPGFNNTEVSGTNGSEALKVVDRRDGACYSLFWLVAKSSHPDGYAITSLNEWHEGTEIEPSFEYGRLYISMTRCETVPVSLFDLAQAYGSKPGDPRWNPATDLSGDGQANLMDLVILAQNYGQHSP